MSSVSVLGALRQARQTVWDPENGGWGDLNCHFADAACRLLEAMAVSEVEYRVGAKLYERGEGRQNQRNGWRERPVQTSFATVRIRIPRLREGGFVPQFLDPRHRAIKATEGFVERALMCGVSRAEIVRLMTIATGCRPSEGLLRSVQEELDKRTDTFRARSLTDQYIYVFLDAAWAKDLVGGHARRICVLTAVGVTAGGRKEVLGFERANQECTSSWSRFLNSLLTRGLDRAALQMVVSDEHEGLLRAVEETLGDVPHQLCWAHRCRNIMDSVAKTDRAEVMQSLRPLYMAEHRRGAQEAFRALKQKWAIRYPRVVVNLEEDLGYLLAFYDVPALHREYVRTTNPIERLFVELRRARFACGAFANRKACDRTVANVYLRLNEIWKERNLWLERERRNKRQAARKASSGCHAQRSDPVSSARGAPQQRPILPDGSINRSTISTEEPA
jgi:putative transposase